MLNWFQCEWTVLIDSVFNWFQCEWTVLIDSVFNWFQCEGTVLIDSVFNWFQCEWTVLIDSVFNWFQCEWTVLIDSVFKMSKLSPFLGSHGIFGYVLFFIFTIKTRTFCENVVVILWVGIIRKFNTCRQKKIKVTRSKQSENKYRHCVKATWTIQWILVHRTPRLHTVYLNRKRLRVQEKINKSMYHNQLWVTKKWVNV